MQRRLATSPSAVLPVCLRVCLRPGGRMECWDGKPKETVSSAWMLNIASCPWCASCRQISINGYPSEFGSREREKTKKRDRFSSLRRPEPDANRSYLASTREVRKESLSVTDDGQI